MHSQELAYEADGLAMRGELYLDETGQGPRPGVIVFPEAFGLGEHAMTRARRLTEQGYVALACDLHGDRAMIDDMEAVKARAMALRADPDAVLRRARGGLRALLARPEVDPSRVAAIGYCFGGTMALELARAGDPVVSVVGFHSGLAAIAPAVGKIGAKVLVCVGADDPSIDAAQRSEFEAEMTGAGADWQMHVYGGVVHSFTNRAADARGAPGFSRYDAAADARSWNAMLGLFDELMTSGRPQGE